MSTCVSTYFFIFFLIYLRLIPFLSFSTFLIYILSFSRFLIILYNFLLLTFLFFIFLYFYISVYVCRRKGDQCEQPALLKSVLDSLRAVHHAFNVSSFILSTLCLETPPRLTSDTTSFQLSLSSSAPEKNNNNNSNNNSNNSNNNNNNNSVNRNRSFQNSSGTDLHQNTVLIEDSLRLLLRMWNSTPENNGNENNNNNGNEKKSVNGGFVRDLAFIQTAEIILKQIGSVETLFEPENRPYLIQNGEIRNYPIMNKSTEKHENKLNFTAENYQKIEKVDNNNNNNDDNNNNNNNNKNKNKNNNNTVIKDSNDVEKHVSYSIIPLTVFSASNRLKVLVERIIQKLLFGMLSDHCKVAPLCISIVEKNAILLKYFVTITEDNNNNSDNSENENENDEDDDYNSGYERDTIEPGPKIPQKIEKLSEKVMEWKRNKFEKLVEILRKNRNHWHPQVKIASGKLFDTLLNYLE